MCSGSASITSIDVILYWCFIGLLIAKRKNMGIYFSIILVNGTIAYFQ